MRLLAGGSSCVGVEEVVPAKVPAQLLLIEKDEYRTFISFIHRHCSFFHTQHWWKYEVWVTHLSVCYLKRGTATSKRQLRPLYVTRLTEPSYMTQTSLLLFIAASMGPCKQCFALQCQLTM